MQLPIVQYPDERLREQSKPVDRLSEDDQVLIDNMIETMHGVPGVGLAAPQVGVLKRILVIDITVGKKPESLLVMVNPEILARDGEKTEEEGCLSIPDFTAEVTRAATVEVGYQNRLGEQVTLSADGLMSKAIQHEMDHLNGILFIDRLSPLKRDMIKRKIKKAIRQGIYQHR
jgi:peptide deformylase